MVEILNGNIAISLQTHNGNNDSSNTINQEDISNSSEDDVSEEDWTPELEILTDSNNLRLMLEALHSGRIVPISHNTYIRIRVEGVFVY